MRRALLTVFLVACSDYHRGVEPDASRAVDVVASDVSPARDAAAPDRSPAADVPGRDAGPIPFDCVAFCEPTRTRCAASAHTACVEQCGRQTANLPRVCGAEVDALFACTRMATVHCETGVDIPFTGCDAPYSALSRCAGR